MGKDLKPINGHKQSPSGAWRPSFMHMTRTTSAGYGHTVQLSLTRDHILLNKVQACRLVFALKKEFELV